MKKLIKQLRLNNNGAAMVSVIVVAAFITILASTMLYFTGMNYQMKSADYQNAKTFYDAEKALDVIKAVLVKDVSVAYELAYRDVMTDYANYSDAEQRNYACAERFVEEMEKIWLARAVGKTEGQKYEEALIELITNDPDIDSAVKSEVVGHIYIDPSEPPINISKVDSEGKFILSNVKVVSHAQGGYNSYIMTDIGLLVPEYDFINGSKSTYEAPAVPVDAEEKILNMSNSVIYMNWRRY